MSVFLSMSACLPVHLPVHLSACLSVHLFIHLSVCLSVCLYVCKLSVHVHLSAYPSVCLSVHPSVCILVYLCLNYTCLCDVIYILNLKLYSVVPFLVVFILISLITAESYPCILIFLLKKKCKVKHTMNSIFCSYHKISSS